MAVQNPKIPLQSLDDLSKSDQYFPIIEYGSVHHSLFEVRYFSVLESYYTNSVLFIITIFAYFYYNIKTAVFQTSKSGVYARLWKRIQENREERLCRGTVDLCSDKWFGQDYLVYIGIAYYIRIRK